MSGGEIDEAVGALIADPDARRELNDDPHAFATRFGLTESSLATVRVRAPDLSYAVETTLRKRVGRIQVRAPLAAEVLRRLGLLPLLAEVTERHLPERGVPDDARRILRAVGELAGLPPLAQLADYEEARASIAAGPSRSGMAAAESIGETPPKYFRLREDVVWLDLEWDIFRFARLFNHGHDTDDYMADLHLALFRDGERVKTVRLQRSAADRLRSSAALDRHEAFVASACSLGLLESTE